MKTKSWTIFLFFTVVLLGCTNAVEDITKDMHKNFENDMSKSLDPFVSTLFFYSYAVPENYWYPEGTTSREVIDDEFRQGLKGLEKLDDKISMINTGNSQIITCIDTLHARIKKEKKGLIEARKGLQQLNGIFGFGLFGGVNTLMDFAELLGGDNKKEDENVSLPKNIRTAFDKLVKEIEESDYQFCRDLHKFEINMIGSHKLNEEQLKEVRKNLKEIVIEQIKQHYTENDTLSRDRMTTMLLRTFDNSFPIGVNLIEINNDNRQSNNYDDNKISDTTTTVSNENTTATIPVDSVKFDKESLESDFFSISAKIDQLDAQGGEERLSQEKAEIDVLQLMVRKILKNNNSTETDFKKVRSMLNELSEKVIKYGEHLKTIKNESKNSN